MFEIICVAIAWFLIGYFYVKNNKDEKGFWGCVAFAAFSPFVYLAYAVVYILNAGFEAQKNAPQKPAAQGKIRDAMQRGDQVYIRYTNGVAAWKKGTLHGWGPDSVSYTDSNGVSRLVTGEAFDGAYY